MNSFFRGGLPLVVWFAFAAISPGHVLSAQSSPAAPQPTMDEVMRRLDALQKKYDELQQRMDARNGASAASAPAPAAPTATEAANPPPMVAEAPPPPPAPAKGGSQMQLIDISLDVLTAAGTSSVTDEKLSELQAGGHDPRKRGFTVQNIELSMSGAVDPYFKGEAHFVYFIEPTSGESFFEMEEAFLITSKMPASLQIKAGQFFTEFGRINPVHPHAWIWEDQPLISARLFGPDGMRGTGARLSWLTPLPWYSEVYAGVQNANGGTMASFLSNESYAANRAIGGRPFVNRSVHRLKDLLYLVRSDNFWDLGDHLTAKFGLSGVFGPNATGPTGKTAIYGTDLLMKWHPDPARSWRMLTWETELMRRNYQADAVVDPLNPANALAPSARLTDWGGYTQVSWGFAPRWVTGIRYEYVTGSGDNLDGTYAPLSRDTDPFRNNRTRISPLLIWRPSEFSRLRLQYNRDRAVTLEDGRANSLWFGFEFLYGSHPAHKY